MSHIYVVVLINELVLTENSIDGQTKLYTEDWIGLKALDDGGKVKYISVPGDHLQIGKDGLSEYVAPYLTG